MNGPEFQTIFNLVVMVAGALAGWVLNTIWQSVKNLQADDKKLTDRIAAAEKLVIGDYVKRDDYREDLRTISASLQRIEEKIDGKADKK